MLRDRVGGDLSKEQREIVRIVRENSLQLQKLIEDLLISPDAGDRNAAVRAGALVGHRSARHQEHKLAAFARMVTFDARLKPVFVIGHAERIARSSITSSPTRSSIHRVPA